LDRCARARTLRGRGRAYAAKGTHRHSESLADHTSLSFLMVLLALAGVTPKVLAAFGTGALLRPIVASVFLRLFGAGDLGPT
jgi:hypothetical protein